MRAIYTLYRAADIDSRVSDELDMVGRTRQRVQCGLAEGSRQLAVGTPRARSRELADTPLRLGRHPQGAVCDICKVTDSASVVDLCMSTLECRDTINSCSCCFTRVRP